MKIVVSSLKRVWNSMDYNMSDLVYYVLLEKESKSSKASGGHLADQRSVRRMKNTIKWHTSSFHVISQSNLYLYSFNFNNWRLSTEEWLLHHLFITSIKLLIVPLYWGKGGLLWWYIRYIILSLFLSNPKKSIPIRTINNWLDTMLEWPPKFGLTLPITTIKKALPFVLVSLLTYWYNIYNILSFSKMRLCCYYTYIVSINKKQILY